MLAYKSGMEELLRHHAQMFSALDALAQLTSVPVCDEKAVMAVRYRLTRASSARRRQVTVLCEHLLAGGCSDPAVLALRDATHLSRAASSSHIGTWTLQQVAADWPGYVRASARMQATLRRELAREVATLSPHFDSKM